MLAARTLDLYPNEAVLDIRREALEPGPVGEYIEVVDVDPASRSCYAPVDLDSPGIVASSGIAPSEGNPQFHQQMTYAVAMKTIEHFETALGRVALWAPRVSIEPGKEMGVEYVQRLRIYPHALRARDGYYSSRRKALLLGYYNVFASEDDAMPERVAFTALSHDVIADETAHALLAGIRSNYAEPTNPDVVAFHEAFADIVAIFQHLTIPEASRGQIAATRGNPERVDLIALVILQSGAASRRYEALQHYFGSVSESGWARRPPKSNDYNRARETGDPELLGAVLSAAVLDAFLQIYRRRAADVLWQSKEADPSGEVDLRPDLVDRLAWEASKVAGHVLTMCIRALDYCPPVDILFGEYLRALITADTDLIPDDTRGYRSAFVEAFRGRGIYARDVRHPSPESLVWQPPPQSLRGLRFRELFSQMSIDWDQYGDRSKAYELSRRNSSVVWSWLMDPTQAGNEELAALGLVRAEKPLPFTIGGKDGGLRRIEVHSVRPARRVSSDGKIRADLLIEITQTFRPAQSPRSPFRGGCTLIIDLGVGEVRYVIRKSVEDAVRLDNQMRFASRIDDGPNAAY